ncbi:hypothetical protein [Candidatus Entotheonella palauensis]|nr:hypothetical protein [Candidatus Entotheonella palauensis]
MMLDLAAELYDQARFDASEDQQQLGVAIEPDAVVQAFLRTVSS